MSNSRSQSTTEAHNSVNWVKRVSNSAKRDETNETSQISYFIVVTIIIIIISLFFPPISFGFFLAARPETSKSGCFFQFWVLRKALAMLQVFNITAFCISVCVFTSICNWCRCRLKFLGVILVTDIMSGTMCILCCFHILCIS